MQAKNEKQYREAWQSWAKEGASLVLAAYDELEIASEEWDHLKMQLDALIDRAAKNQDWGAA